MGQIKQISIEIDNICNDLTTTLQNFKDKYPDFINGLVANIKKALFEFESE